MSGPSTPDRRALPFVTQLRALVVEDDPTGRLQLTAALERRGHTVVSVESAEAALEHLGRERFQIFVFDWMLPGMSGLELTRQVRRLSGSRPIAVLVVTSRVGIEDLEQVMDAGASDFLPKPFQLHELMVRLSVAEHGIEQQRQRFRAERALEATKNELESLFLSLPVGVVKVNSELAVERVNPAFLRLTRLAAQAPLGEPLASFLTDEEWVGRQVEVLSAGHVSVVQEQVRIIRADGTSFTAEVVLSANRDAQGRITSYVCAVLDATLQTEMWQHMRITDRLAQIGTLASGVSHEINNPLTSILGNLSYLEGELDNLGPTADIEELKLTVHDAQLGCERVREIVHKLRTYARADESVMNLVDLADLCGESLALLAGKLRPRADVHTEFGPVPLVQANPTSLGQVLLNMIRNAEEAFPEGRRGTITLRTYTQDDWAVVEVEDDGPGIPPDVKARMFDPFFTTKLGTKATGLGLATSESIVTGLGGTIVCESTQGEGTLFRITLPGTPD